MNLELLESFGQNYPEEFDGTLDCVSLAVTCSFNKRGTLLAVGCNDGRIVIWDFLTRGIAKIISAHMHPVCSISWSRNGCKLVSASTDNNVCIWDVLAGECEQRYRFPSPILKVQFHPRNDKLFLVCPMKHASVLVDLEGEHHIIPTDDDSDLTIVASFDRRGQYIYTGNGKGKVLVLSCPALEVEASFKINSSSATAVKSIEFARRGEKNRSVSEVLSRIFEKTVLACQTGMKFSVPFEYEGWYVTDSATEAIIARPPSHYKFVLFNCSDRVVRVYNSEHIVSVGKDGEVEPIQKLQDLVNKTMWKKCCFSGDGEYVCAGSARQHALYIWEKSIGNLVKILHGMKGELLLDVVWHPVRPIIASISSGVVSIWAQNQVENWSAFAPDFKELDENVEYEERESEFDLSDEDKSVTAGPETKDEDVEIDVTTCEHIPAFCSSDEETEDDNVLQFLPIAPEVEDPEDTAPVTLSGRDSPPAKRPKYKSYDIHLEGTSDEPHPLLNVRTNNKQPAAGKKGSGKRISK